MGDAPERTWPALDLDARPDRRLPADFDDRLALVLDDCAPLAVEGEGGHRRVYFAHAIGRAAARSTLTAALGAHVSVEDADVADEGWAAKVQRTLGPVAIDDIVVAPPWAVPASRVTPAPSSAPPAVAGGPAWDPEMPAPGGRRPAADSHRPRPEARRPLVIVIEPSTGFGTGHHQSTRLCLRLLQRLPLGGTRVIDVGTGSGVLGIAAALGGARSVLAIDNDPDAVAAAADNVARNGVGGRVEVRAADLAEAVLPAADVVVANLTAMTLRRYRDELARLVAPRGALVASGFTADQAPLVVDSLCALQEIAREDEDDWVAIRFAAP